MKPSYALERPKLSGCLDLAMVTCIQDKEAKNSDVKWLRCLCHALIIHWWWTGWLSLGLSHGQGMLPGQLLIQTDGIDQNLVQACLLLSSNEFACIGGIKHIGIQWLYTIGSSSVLGMVVVGYQVAKATLSPWPRDVTCGVDGL